MAFETLGIGGVLTFNDTQAVKAMGRTSAAFSRVERRAQSLQVGVQRVGAGVRSIGMMSIGAAAGLGFGAKSAIDFEHNMAAVGAITRSTGEELKKNTAFARKLGIETKFSALQSSEALKILAKFGLAKEPLRAAAKGVTDLAAAEEIDLASASRVAIGSLRAMNMSVMETGKASDVLALTSSSTAANVISLGESFAYAGGTAKSMNLTYEQSSAVFGLLANRMITGSRAGTGLMALFRGLQGTTGPSVKMMKQLGVNVKAFGGDLRRLPEIISTIDAALKKKFQTPIERARAVTKIFGRFGQVAFFALAGAGGKALSDLTKKLEKAGTAFKDKFGRPIGAAAWMAQQRMNTVKGRITLLKSSIEAFFITIFQGFLGPMKDRIDSITKSFNNVLFALQALEGDDSVKNQNKLIAKYGRTTMQVALGVRDALGMVRSMWSAVGNALKKVGMLFGRTIGKGAIRTVVKLVLGFTMILASIAPLFVALFGIKMIFGAIASIASGAFIIIKAAALPVLAVVAAIAAALLIARNEGESLGQTAMRLLSGIATAIMALYNTAIKPLFLGIWSIIRAFTVGMSAFWAEVIAKIKAHVTSVIMVFGRAVALVISILTPVFSIIKSIILRLRPVFKAYIRYQLAVWGVMIKIGKGLMGVAEAVGNIIKSILSILRPMLEEIGSIFSAIFSGLYKLMTTVWNVAGKIISFLLDATKKWLLFLKPIFTILAKIIVVFYRIGRVIVELLIAPIRVMIQMLTTIGSIVWEKIKPGFSAIGGTLKTVYSFILRIGKAVISVLVTPMKKLAEFMALALYKLESVAKYIPGLSVANVRKLRQAMEAFAGTAITVKQPALGPIRRARRVEVKQYTKAQHLAQSEAALKAAKLREKREAAKVTIKDKRQYSFKSQSSIDGRCVASATARHRVEIEERAGFGVTPWQRRAVILRSTDMAPTKAR